MTPFSNARISPFLVTFIQQSSSVLSVEMDTLNGALPGPYAIVVHTGGSCGTDGDRAGNVWPTRVALRAIVNSDLSGGLETNEIRLALTGEHGLIGKTLVLHKGDPSTPEVALACGVIEMLDDEP